MLTNVGAPLNRHLLKVKRVNSISRSPIYANFEETLHGVAVICAFKQQAQWTRRNDERTDLNYAWLYVGMALSRWLQLRLSLLLSLLPLSLLPLRRLSLLRLLPLSLLRLLPLSFLQVHRAPVAANLEQRIRAAIRKPLFLMTRLTSR